MARKMKLALLADDISAGVDAVEMTDEAIDAAIEDPAIASAAVEDDTDQLVLDNEEIEESAADAEALSEAAGVLEEGADAGEAISPVAAEAIRILAARITSRHQGIQSGGLNIAAESFKSKTGRMAAQRVAMESLESFAKNIWKQIVKAYERVIEFFKKWWNKFFDGATKLRDRAEALVKTVKSKSTKFEANKAKGSGSIDGGGWAVALQDKTGALTPDVIAAAGSGIVTEYDATTQGVNKLVGDMMTNATTFMNSGVATESALSDHGTVGAEQAAKRARAAAEAAQDIFKDVTGKLKSSASEASHLGEAPDNMLYLGAPLSIGGKSMFFCDFAKDISPEDMADSIGHLKFWIDESKGYVDNPEVKFSIKDVSADQMDKICKNVQNLGIRMIKDKEVGSSIDAKAKKIKERAAKLAGYADKAEDDSRSDEIRCMGAAARAAIQMASSGIAQLRTHYLTTGNALLSYVMAVLGYTGTKEDKKNKEIDIKP